MSAEGETVKLLEVQAKVENLERENARLRAILARSSEPCIYCGLKDMSMCKSGFPGCARMDDITAGGK